MKPLTCAAVERRLHAFYDGELSIDDQIAVAAHLDLCRACAEALDDLHLLGDALRAGATTQATLSVDEAAGFRAGVVNRIKAEHDTSLVARVSLMFEDMHLVYAGVGATVATVVCVSIMLGMMRFATNEHPASLAAMVSFLATPGSNADAAAIDAESQARWTARFEAANETAEQETVFTLAEALTHEGRIAKLEHLRASDRKTALHAGPGSHGLSDAKLIEGLLDAVSRARLGPAQAEGLPASGNMVWMITRTTVRASQSSVPVDLPLPPAPKKRASVPSAATHLAITVA